MPTALEMLAARLGINPQTPMDPQLAMAQQGQMPPQEQQTMAPIARDLAQQPKINPAPTQQNPYDQLSSQMQRAEAQKKAKLEQYLTMNKQGLSELESAVRAPQESRADLSPLLALSDAWYGGNLQKGYRPPPTQEDKRTQGLGEMSALQQRRESLAKIAEGADSTGSNYIKLLMAQQRQGETNQRADEKKTADLSNRLEKSGLSDLDPVIENVNSMIPGGGDIPGFGASALLPDLLIGKPGTDARQAVAGLKNIILKARSGGAVTPSEAERMLEEIGSGLGRTDDQLRVGISNVVNQLAAKKQGIVAGYRPEISGAYSKQGGNVSIPKATFAGGPKPGDIQDGHRFKGGNPADQNNWEAVR